MHNKVAVEKGLSAVKDYFEHKNFQVDVFEDYELKNIGHVSAFDAIIISGTSGHYTGNKNAYDHTPVITANGLTPEDIYKKIN